MPILDDGEVETEGLIREYQRNAKPIQSTIKLLEFYGGEDWRKNEGAGMKRCIQRLVEEELVKEYQRMYPTFSGGRISQGISKERNKSQRKKSRR